MAGLKTLYSGTALECALELLWRSLGVRLEPEFVTCTITPVDALRARLNVTARMGANNTPSIYAGAADYVYRKFPLETIAPTDLVYDGEFPMSFERLQQFLSFAYGFTLEANEFAIDRGSVLDAPLRAGDTIQGPLQAGDMLVLSATLQSGRWTQGSTLRMKVLPFGG